MKSFVVFQFTILSAFAVLAMGHECMYDRLQRDTKVTVNEAPYAHRPSKNIDMRTARMFAAEFRQHGQAPVKRRLHNSGTRVGLRIHADFSYLNDSSRTCFNVGDAVVSADSNSNTVTCRENDLVPIASSKRSFIEDITALVEGLYYDVLEPKVRAGGINDGLTPSTATCGGLPVPSAMRSNGIPDTDIVLFVTAQPFEDANSNQLGWALDCEDDTRGRTLVGRVNLNPAKISGSRSQVDLTNEDDKQLFIIIVHEVAHALGFSSSKYLGTAGTTKMPKNDDYSNPVFYATAEISTTYSMEGIHDIQMLTTPRVKQYVRDHFGCSSLGGAALEDGGGPGTEISHWEKRVYADEFMTGTYSSGAKISQLTLAFFEDSGWYIVTNASSHLGEFTFGKGLGCSFALGNCAEGPWLANAGYSCTARSQSSCSHDRRFIQSCDYYSASVPSTMPVTYRHFSDRDETKIQYEGGSSWVKDFCPAFISTSNGDCLDATYETNLGFAVPYGEDFGPTSACFRSSILRNTLSSSGGEQSMCYSFSCSANGITVSFALTSGTRERLCPVLGGLLENVDGFNGYLICPPARDLCPSYVFPTTKVSSISVSSLPPTADGRTISITGENFPVSVASAINIDVAKGQVVLYANYEKIGTLQSITSTSAEFTFELASGLTAIPATGIATVQLGLFGKTIDSNVQLNIGSTGFGLSSVEPSVAGTSVASTLTLTGLFPSNIAPYTVHLGGLSRTAVWISSTTIEVTFSNYPNPSATTIAVSDANNAIARYGVAIFVLDESFPQVSSVYPASLGIASSWILVRGKNFATITSVQIGAVEASEIHRVSSRAVYARFPSQSQPINDATLRLGDSQGREVSFQSGSLERSAQGVAVNSVIPTEGSVFGGTSLTIAGSGFEGETLRVRIGGYEALYATVVSNSEVHCLTPRIPFNPIQTLDLNGTGFGEVNVEVLFGTDKSGICEEFYLLVLFEFHSLSVL
mmetsp:Transcript_10188/g.26692  ORF Transcript_10188/g.26692 Transcript_10188/m.26692 type:complete len:980 (-) Transcript_10188:417-3356(-)